MVHPLWHSGNLFAMAVLYTPQTRLERTRVVIATQARRDLQPWKQWCASVSSDGAGMIVVSNPGFDSALLAEVLASAREVVGRGLVAAVEPIEAEVRADVVHVSTPDHASMWKQRLAGCQVSSIDQAREAIGAGCAYLVADLSVEGLVAQMADLAVTHSDLIWFVSGCSSISDLDMARNLGARRVWMEAEMDVAVRMWANHLRKKSTMETGELTKRFPWMGTHDS